MPIGVDHGAWWDGYVRIYPRLITFDADRRWSPNIGQAIGLEIACLITFDADRRWSRSQYWVNLCCFISLITFDADRRYHFFLSS